MMMMSVAKPMSKTPDMAMRNKNNDRNMAS